MPNWDRKPDVPLEEKTPCFLHQSKGVGFKKGCKDCQEANNRTDDDLWHDTWERDNFGDRD